MSALFPSLRPLAPPPSCTLILGDVREAIAAARARGGARLVIADPPWRYDQQAGVANPEEQGIYGGMSDADISAVLAEALTASLPGARLACWTTWPKMPEWLAAGGLGGWRYVSGGAWVKSPHVGVGYHWRGGSEPVLLGVAPGAAGRPREMVHSGFTSQPGQHSQKPVEWMRSWIRAWTDPEDLVLDLWSGTGAALEAAVLEGRPCIGAEIDPERHADAAARLARSPQKTAHAPWTPR